MAMTGAVFGNKCYPSQSEALDAYYSTTAPAQTSGSTSYVNEFVKSAGGVWQIKGYSVSSSGVWTSRYTTNAPVINFPACDPSASFQDGVAVGWGIAAAIVTAFAFRLMQRAAA